MTMTETSTPTSTSQSTGDQSNGTGPDLEIPPQWKLASLPSADDGLDATLDGDLGPVVDKLVEHLGRNVDAFPEQRRWKNVIAALDNQKAKQDVASKARLEVEETLKGYQPHAARVLDLTKKRIDANYQFQVAKFELDRDSSKLSADQLKARRQQVADLEKTFREVNEQATAADAALEVASRWADANHAHEVAKANLDRVKDRLTNEEVAVRQKEIDDLKGVFDTADARLKQAVADGADPGETEAVTKHLLASRRLVHAITETGDGPLAERTRRRLMPSSNLDPKVARQGLDDVVTSFNETFQRQTVDRQEAEARSRKAGTSTKKQRDSLKSALAALKKVRQDHPETTKLFKAASTDLAEKRAAAKEANDRRAKAASDKATADKVYAAASKRYFADGLPSTDPGIKKRFFEAADAVTAAEAELTAAKKQAKKANGDADSAQTKAERLDPDRRFLDAMGAVRKALPKGGFDHATVEALEATAKVAIMDKTYEATKKKLVPNFDRLRKAGSKDTTSIQLELGASFNAVFASIDVSHITDVEMSVERTGSGKFKATTSVSMKVRGAGKGGVEATDGTKLLIKTGVDVGGSVAKERTYDTLEDLVTSESNLILAAAMTGKNRRANRKFMQERAKLLAVDYQNRDMMWKRLQLMNALPATRGPNDPADPSKWTGTPKRFKAHPAHRVDLVRTTVKTGAVNVDGSVTASLTDNAKLGGGLGLTHKEKSSRNYKTVSFIDDVLGNDGLQRLHAYKHGSNFSYMEYDDDGKFVKDHWGQDGADALFALGDEIAKVKATDPSDDDGKSEKQAHLDRARTKLMAGLEMLRMEYDGYVLITHQMDDGQISSSQDNKAQRDRFPQLRKLKGSNPAEYVKALSVQYAVMRNLYEKTFDTDADGKPALPTNERAALDRFKDDLQTPRIKLTDKQLQDVYGVDAVSDKSRVSSTAFSMKFNAAGYFKQDKTFVDSNPNDKNGPRKVSQKESAGISLSASYTIDTTVKGGKKSKAVSLVLDIGSGAGFINTDDDPGEREKWVTAVVGKLINAGDFKALAKKSPGLEAETKKALLSLLASGQRVQFDFTEVHGELRLKTASASQQKTRKIGFRTKVPTTGPSVVVGMNVARTKKQVTRIYHASNTLGAVTDAYRSAVRTQGDGSEDTDGWTSFKERSNLLKRMTRQLGSDDANSDQSSLSGDEAKSFAIYLRQIKAGQKMKGTDASRRLGSGNESFGMINETVDWLVDLSTSSDEDDKAAANAFIDTYLENQAKLKAFARRKNGKPTGDEQKAADAIEQAMNDLVLAKAKKEDRTAADDYKPVRGFNTADLNSYIGDRLADHTEKLIAKMVKAENQGLTVDADDLIKAMAETTSIARLRKRALRLYNADPSEANYEVVKETLALEYAANTLDDLTMFNDDGDKNTAMGMLGADLDDTLKKSKVYVNDMIEADLARDKDGNLALTPVIKKGMSKVVKKNMYQEHVTDVLNGIRSDASDDTGNGSSKGFTLKAKSPMMISDYGGAEMRWSSQRHYDSQARQEYFKKRADKAHYWGIGTSKRAKKNLRARDKEKSIGAMLEKVLTARAEQQRRRRQLEKQKRQQQAQKAASSTGN